MNSRGAGPRIRIVFANADRCVLKNKDRAHFRSSFRFFDRRAGNAKNRFRDDFLDAFYIDFVLLKSHK